MDEAKFHEFKIDLPFTVALRKVEEIMGNRLYYLHNRAGGSDWCVRHNQGRVYVQVRDAEMSTFLKLKL